MKKRLSLFLPVLAISLVVGLTAAPTAASQTVNITAPCTALGSAGTFVGTFEPTRFAVQGGQLVLLGALEGVCTTTAGTVDVDQNVAIPVLDLTPEQASCQILDLTLGPLELDLLGLVINLSQVDLDITAVPGAGNLLGNLLCAVAGLLDGGLLNQVTTILNRLLGRGLIVIG